MPAIRYVSEEEGGSMPIGQLHENLTGNHGVGGTLTYP
jgi:hypothetical protein